ncbi:MAG: HPr kinase/phosphatase C-terminal domain-containing protein [Pseudomonadota bacterium]|nr:HPr kinase/phosphatase C-terminal domain-containing protein [Pseudomonadota bacterium]
MEIVHATAIAIDGKGVLLRGPSGSGKSDLALRLLEAGGVLVGDDRVALSVRDDFVVARVPETIAGKLEIRGLGIVQLPYQAETRVTLVADLVERGEVERLPQKRMVELIGQMVPVIQLNPFEESAVAKLKMAATLEPSKIER